MPASLFSSAAQKLKVRANPYDQAQRMVCSRPWGHSSIPSCRAKENGIHFTKQFTRQDEMEKTAQSAPFLLLDCWGTLGTSLVKPLLFQDQNESVWE